MYLANGTVCLSLLGAFPGGWSGFGAAVFLPGGKKYGAGAARCSRGRAGLRRHGRYPPAPGGYRGDAVAVPGLGGHWWDEKFGAQLCGVANEAQMNIRRI